MHDLALSSALTRWSLISWHIALFGKLLSILSHLVQMSLPLGSLSGLPKHSYILCVVCPQHSTQASYSYWAGQWGLGRITYSPFLLPPHIKGAYFCLMGTGMQVEKSEGYSGKELGREARKETQLWGKQSHWERRQHCVWQRRLAMEAALGSLMGKRFRGDFQEPLPRSAQYNALFCLSSRHLVKINIIALGVCVFWMVCYVRDDEGNERTCERCVCFPGKLSSSTAGTTCYSSLHPCCGSS